MEGSRALQPLGKAGVHRRLRGAARKHTRGESTRGGGRHGRLLVRRVRSHRDAIHSLSCCGERPTPCATCGDRPKLRVGSAWSVCVPEQGVAGRGRRALRNLRRSTQAEGRERVERVCVCQAEGRERVERVCA